MQLGTIEGEVDTSSFDFRATEDVGKFDFVSVKSNDRWVLAQVDEVKKKTDSTIATANIIGYRDKGMTRAPRHVIEPDSIVYSADQELISDTLGLKDDGLRVGNLETNEDIDIFVNPEDFYKHFAVLAQTGAGKCVTPGTPVLKSDGTTEEIRDVFEDAGQTVKTGDHEELRMLENCSVKAVDDDYRMTDADALYAYRKRADRILEIRTASGRRIEVTPEHPLMVAEEGYSFVDSEDVEEGQHLAVPRKIDTRSNQGIEFSEAFSRQADEESARRRKVLRSYEQYQKLSEKGCSVSEIASELEVSKSTVENWEYQGFLPDRDQGLALSINAKGIEVPETFSQDFAEFMSLVIAEGTEQQSDGSYRIIFTNNERRLLNRFRELAEDLFGLETRSMEENSDYLDSTSLKHLLDDIGYKTLRKSRGKEIPDPVMASSRESMRTFLRTFFDCEGCMEDHEITLSSASEQIISSLSYMLLEFGIVSRISSREKEASNSGHDGDIYYRLSISGTEDLSRFSDSIGFGIESKQEKLDEYLSGKDGTTNTDVIPVEGERLKKEREKLGLSQKELAEKIDSHSTLISMYERNERRPSRQKFSSVADVLDSKLFSQLSDSDIFWDKIESIEEKQYNDYVYDLTVRDHHNFVAGRGGIVSHNSYLTGVLIEEMLEQDFPVMVIDPHGEFSSLQNPNPENPESSKGYEVKEYSPNTDINKSAMPLEFSSLNFDKKELQTLIPDSLTNSQMGVLYNSLKRLNEKNDDYKLVDIMDAVQQEDSTAKWNLLNYLEQLEDSGLFSDNPIELKDLVNKGEASIINLKAVEPESAEMAVYMLAKKLFDMRKKDRIPPFIMVFEEAHNFIPEKGFGQAISNPIMRKIASEGRKFGLGIGVISQRPARIDKNVLSQCNTQFILKVTNPNDLKAISKSFEGVTSGVEDMIKSLPPGVCFVLGNQYPVMTDVRQRKSQHGGETQTAETYEEKKPVKVFETRKRKSEVENMYGEKFSTTYYPLYLLENDEKEMLIDGIENSVKAERKKPEGPEKDILHKVKQGADKSSIVDELGISVARLGNRLQGLREKGLLKEEGMALKESVLDLELEDEDAAEDDILDFDIDVEEASERLKDASVKEVYYPYYSSEDTVYDPILEKEIG